MRGKGRGLKWTNALKNMECGKHSLTSIVSVVSESPTIGATELTIASLIISDNKLGSGYYALTERGLPLTDVRARQYTIS